MVSKTIKATVGQKIAYKIIKDGFKTVNGTIDVTSDMDTNVSIETPSTPYTSNIDYSIVENDAFPSIFKLNEDVVLPDDSVLEKNDYLLYPKGEYLVTDDSNEMVYENNFTINGSVKNVGYTFSNFSSSNYLTLQERFNPVNKPWEFVTKFNLTSTTDGHFIGYIGSGLFNVSVWEGKVCFCTSTVTNSWNICELASKSTLSTNTDYWVKAEFTGSAYNLYLSTDGIEYRLEASQESTSIVTFPETTCIGCGGWNSSNLKGSMDLSETYIKIDGEIWWKPQVANMNHNYVINGSCALIRDGMARNFSATNYIALDNTQYSSTENVNYVFKFNAPSTSLSSSQCVFEQDYFANLEFRGNTQDFRAWNWQTNQYEYIMTPELGKTYWFKVNVNGQTKTYYWSEDGVNYDNSYVMTDTNMNTTSGLMYIGRTNGGGNIYQEKIDVRNSWVEINGTKYYINDICSFDGYWNNDGMTKGFSSSNYVTISQPFKPESHPWEIGFKIRPTDITSMQRLIGQVGGYYATIGGEVQSNGTLGFGLTTTGYNWDIAWFGGRVVLTPNEWHWIRLSFTGSEYKYELSTNGVDYELVDSVTNSTPIRQGDDSIINLGYHGTDSNCPFKGAIDLSESYIKIDDKLWWQGISKNKFKKGNFKMIGSPNISMNGVVSNFSDYNYIVFPYAGNNETEIFTTFITGTDISNMANIITFIGAGEIYIRDSVIQTWNIETATDITLTSMLPNTMYSLRMKMIPNGRIITIYDADNTIIVEQTINDSGATFNNNSIVNFGFYNANSTFRYWKGSIDLANTYVIIDDVKYNLLENDGRYLQGIFDESFVDNYNQEQVVKLYHTMSKNNGLTITNDKVNDENVLYSQYIDNVTIPPRTTQFTYNIDNESWKIV